MLGPLEILDEERAIELPSGKPRALLALLMLDAPRVVSVDRLVDRLWGAAPPATAGKMVQGYVWRLRKALPGGGMLETRPPGYCLDVSDSQTDLGRFRRLLREADAAAEAGRLQGAVAGLIGMKDRVSKPSAEQLPATPIPSQEDLAKYEQMIEEAKGIIEAMEKEFEKENPKSVTTSVAHGTTASRTKTS